MATEKRTMGLKSIKVGDIAVDGGMGTTLAALGTTYLGTAKLTQDDAEITEHNCEELDDPIETSVVAGKTVLEFAITDFTPATLVKVLGGEVTGTGDAAKWEKPTTDPTTEQSIEIITKKNVIVQIPRARIEAKLEMDLTKTELSKVLIKATVLTPTKADTAPMSIGSVA